MLRRFYGRQVELVYQCVSKDAFGGQELPVVLVNGEVIAAGGVPPLAVVGHLDRLGIPRTAGKEKNGLRSSFFG
ncbi:MAG: hypothetical protein AB1556_10195 [Bacillota bacterium]